MLADPRRTLLIDVWKPLHDTECSLRSIIPFTVTVIVLLLWLGRRTWKLAHEPNDLNDRQVFVLKVSSGIHFIAALATVFVGMQLVFLPPCI